MITSDLTERDRATLEEIEYLGGVLKALEEGFKAEDFDSKVLRTAWSQLEESFRGMTDNIHIIDNALDEVFEEEPTMEVFEY